MKYIHHYQTNSQFQQDYNGSNYVEPWVSYVEETSGTSYNKEPENYTIKLYTEIFNPQIGDIDWNSSVAQTPICSYTITDYNELRTGNWFTGIHEGTGAVLTLGSYEIGEGFLFYNNLSLKSHEYEPRTWMVQLRKAWTDSGWVEIPNETMFGEGRDWWAETIWEYTIWYLRENKSIDVVYTRIDSNNESD